MCWTPGWADAVAAIFRMGLMAVAVCDVIQDVEQHAPGSLSRLKS